jgi:LPS O-antigen subunit length determinant protein (WzzB/FepE family)
MQLAVVLIVVGLILGLPTVMYRYSRPRRPGEPFGPVRAVLLSLSLIGLLMALVGAAMLFSG